MKPTRVCDDVGYAISARTYECEDNVGLAERRFDDFERDFNCRVKSLDEPIERYYHCPVAVNALSCREVTQFGDDLLLWLSASSTCSVILEHADGTQLESNAP